MATGLAIGPCHAGNTRSRQRLIYGLMAAQLALFMLASAAPGNTGNNPTWLENQNAGTPNWQVGLAPYHRSDDFTKQIQGYASARMVKILERSEWAKSYDGFWLWRTRRIGSGC